MAAGGWQKNLTVKIVDGKGKSVFAKNDIMSGMIIGYVEGHETSSHTMHSLYLDGKIIEAAGILRNLSQFHVILMLALKTISAGYIPSRVLKRAMK